MSIVYIFSRFICYVVCRFYLEYVAIGRENIPKKGAFIYCSNHTSFLDPIMLGISTPRNIFYLARAIFFKTRFSSWYFRNINAIPVRNKNGDVASIRMAIRRLKDGMPLVIFPEGMRSKDGKLRGGKPGIGFVAAKAGVPVIPAYSEGSFDACPKGIKTLKRSPIKLYIGKPMYFDIKRQDQGDKEAYQKISFQIMQRIAEIKEFYGCR